MTVTLQLVDIQLTCPNCSRSFSAKKVVGHAAVVRKRTDFHECLDSGEIVTPLVVYLCDSCGFCGFARSYEDGGIDFSASQLIAEILRPNIPYARVSGVERYYHAVKVAQWTNQLPAVIGEFAIRGAWCAVEEVDHESERWFRRVAAEEFTEALKTYDGVERAQRAVYTYLIGELWRRLGERELAAKWFDHVEEEVVDVATQSWVLLAARRQRVTPQEFL